MLQNKNIFKEMSVRYLWFKIMHVDAQFENISWNWIFFFAVCDSLEIIQQNSFIPYEAILLNNLHVELLKLRGVAELK